MRFSQIVAMKNEETKLRLLRYAQKGAGNIILYGQPGLGQETLVRKAVHGYTCIGDHSENCTCKACQSTIEKNPDVLWIKAKKASLSVDELSPIETFTECYPVISKTRVIVLEGIETASEQAENMILKSMEDGNVVRYVCIAYANKVRATIASRCTPYTLVPLSLPEFSQEMASKLVSEDEKHFWYCASGGCPGKMDKISAEGKTALYRATYQAYCSHDLKALLEALGLFREKDRNSIYQKNRDEIHGVLTMLLTTAYAMAVNEIPSAYTLDVLIDQIKILGKEKEECKKPGYMQSQLLNAMLLMVK